MCGERTCQETRGFHSRLAAQARRQPHPPRLPGKSDFFWFKSLVVRTNVLFLFAAKVRVVSRVSRGRGSSVEFCLHHPLCLLHVRQSGSRKGDVIDTLHRFQLKNGEVLNVVFVLCVSADSLFDLLRTVSHLLSGSHLPTSQVATGRLVVVLSSLSVLPRLRKARQCKNHLYNNFG